MSEFWIWFWRPLAEITGVMVVLTVCVALVFAWSTASYYIGRLRRWLRCRKESA